MYRLRLHGTDTFDHTVGLAEGGARHPGAADTQSTQFCFTQKKPCLERTNEKPLGPFFSQHSNIP